MSRRLSKKSRATKLATTVAFSAANLPKLDTSVLDALFARSPARKRSLRASLLVGSALTAGLLATSLVDVSPALAACSGAGTVTCTGDFPTPTGLPNFTGNTTVNLTGAIVGGNSTDGNNGVVLDATTFGQTLTTNVNGASSIGVGANYVVGADGINMYSHFTGTTLSVSNAGAITATTPSIYTRINDTFETANDHIAIINSAQLYSGTTAIVAEIQANVPSTFTAVNTIFITNSGQIGAKGKYTGGDGIYSLINKTGFVYMPIQVPASITGTNIQYHSNNIYSAGDGEFAKTTIVDVKGGGGFATSGLTNTGNVTSQDGTDLHAYALGGTAGGGTGMASVVISNAATGTLIAQAGGGDGILGYARARTGYNTGGATKS